MRPTVVKLGGNAIDGVGLADVAADLAKLSRRLQLVVVHGGGPQVTALQKQLGQTPKQVAGRRVTDRAALDVLEMVVGGKLNIDLCAALLAAGAEPVGLHGASSLVLEASRRGASVYAGHPEPVDLGLVGDVTHVNRRLITLLLEAGHVPVLACIGAARDGSVYNINADVVAHRVAVELAAEALVVVSDVRGVLRDVADPTSRIALLREAEAREAIARGVVSAGMIPKLEEAFEAIARGVGRVHIVGQLQKGELERELEQPGSVGTALVGGAHQKLP